VNVGKTISRQHQNMTAFSVENAEHSFTNPVPYMGCFVIDVKELRREKVRRKRDRNSEEG
jgi:hypothetical protein